MNKKRETKKVPPSANRLIEALRDTGYSFHTAIADLVDNSIAALATHVKIEAFIDDQGKQVLYICDNGHGMDAETLEDAMV